MSFLVCLGQQEKVGTSFAHRTPAHVTDFEMYYHSQNE